MAATASNRRSTSTSPVKPLAHFHPLQAFERRRQLRAIEELLAHPERVVDSPTASDFSHSVVLPAADPPATAATKADEITLLLSNNLDFYNCAAYFDSYIKDLSKSGRDLVPLPLFHDAETSSFRGLLQPLRRTQTSPEYRNRPQSRGFRVTGDGSPTRTSTLKGRSADLVLIPPCAISRKSSNASPRRSLSSLHQHSRIPSPVRDTAEPVLSRKFVAELADGERLTTRTPTRPSPIAILSSPKWNSSLNAPRLTSGSPGERNLQVGSPLGYPLLPPADTNGAFLRSGLKPDQHFILSPRLQLKGLEIPPPCNGSRRRKVYRSDERIVQPSFEIPKLRSANMTVNFKKIDFQLEHPRPRLPSPFPEDVIKISLVDMATEGWFHRGDTWIYKQGTSDSTRKVGPCKELRVGSIFCRSIGDRLKLTNSEQICKVDHEGTITVEMARGTMEQVSTHDIHAIVPRSSDPPLQFHPAQSPTKSAAFKKLAADLGLPEQAPSTRHVSVYPRSAPGPDHSEATSSRVRGGPSLWGPRPQKPRDRSRKASINANAVIFEIRLLQELERHLLEIDQRFDTSISQQDFAGNLWKQISCKRGDENLGTLFELRKKAAASWKSNVWQTLR